MRNDKAINRNRLKDDTVDYQKILNDYDYYKL